MNNPLYIFSWQVQPEINVGDKVRVIAPEPLLDSIGILGEREIYSDIFTVEIIAPTETSWTSQHLGDDAPYIGFVEAGEWAFPYSHWREFIEVVEHADNVESSLKLGWQTIRKVPYDKSVEHGWGAFGDRKVESENVFDINGKYYQFLKPITYKQLQVGNIYGDSYSKFNRGYGVFEFLGYSDIDVKYGEGGVKFDNIKDVFRKYNATSLKQLEENVNNKARELYGRDSYGHDIYMWVHDLESGSEGGYYYLSEGRWVRGSGAEPLTFWEVEEVDAEISPESSLKFSWQVPPEPEKRVVDDIIDPLGAPVALDYHLPMEKVLIICPWCTVDVGETEPTTFGQVYDKGFALIKKHMPNCPNKNATLKDMMVTLRSSSKEASLKFSWQIRPETDWKEDLLSFIGELEKSGVLYTFNYYTDTDSLINRISDKAIHDTLMVLNEWAVNHKDYMRTDTYHRHDEKDLLEENPNIVRLIGHLEQYVERSEEQWRQSSLKLGWQIRQELKNGLNADEKRRNEIITGTTDDFPHGLIDFDISLPQLELLVQENFIRLQEAQNDSPTTEEFLHFMRNFPEVKAMGYALPLYRDDYRVVIEGLKYNGHISDELGEAFDQFSEADEYENTFFKLKCWYD